MRTRLRQLLVGLLCLSLLPGWVELVETVEHLWHDGQPSHLVNHEHNEHHQHPSPSGSDDHGHERAHAALEAEHGCTPVAHSCGCHVSIPGILASVADVPAFQAAFALTSDRPLGLVATPLNRANAPPVPPPRA